MDIPHLRGGYVIVVRWISRVYCALGELHTTALGSTITIHTQISMVQVACTMNTYILIRSCYPTHLQLSIVVNTL